MFKFCYAYIVKIFLFVVVATQAKPVWEYLMNLCENESFHFGRETDNK